MTIWWILLVIAALTAGFVIGRRTPRRLKPSGPAPSRHANGPTITPAQPAENFQAVNALLRTLTRSTDITQSLFDLALRIRDIVPCDRVGLALLTADGDGYNTYTARLDSTGAPAPRAELHFPRSPTVIDEVVIRREGRVVADITSLAPTHLDANVAKSAGFVSFVLVPLIFEGEALGTLNLASRRPAAFADAHLDTLKPVAEALAVAHGTRRLANALARHQLANEFSEMTFAFANDMNGAVQSIVGRCELLAHTTQDPAFEHELAAMLQQARRLRDILSNMQRMTREHVASGSTKSR